MQSIDLIRDNLKRSTELVLGRVEEMRENAVVFPTPNGGCHTLWVLGHDGEDVSGDESLCPPFDDVLTECRATRESTVALIDSLSESDLDTKSAAAPNGYEDLFGTYRRCLRYAADHWYMHRGQLADARRAAGLERMWL